MFLIVFNVFYLSNVATNRKRLAHLWRARARSLGDGDISISHVFGDLFGDTVTHFSVNELGSIASLLFVFLFFRTSIEHPRSRSG